MLPSPSPALLQGEREIRFYFALSLDSDGEFDEEGRASGFVVSYPDISVVIRDDGVDNGQP